MPYLLERILWRWREAKWAFMFFVMHPTNRVRLRGHGNHLVWEAARSKRVFVDVVGHDNEVTVGAGCHLSGVTLRIRANGAKVQLGTDVQIDTDTLLQCQHKDSQIVVGDKTTIVSAHIVAAEGRSISIGQRCMLSGGIVIRNSDSHPIFFRTDNSRINPAADIVIANDVWIGSGVRVLKGARIGAGSILGEASIVTGTIGANVVAVGIPARAVRHDVVWQRDYPQPAERKSDQS